MNMDLSVNKQLSDETPSRSFLLKVRGLIEAARPRQWTKNLVVLVAFFFALGDKQQNISPLLFFGAFFAAVLFSITSSGVYLFNDIFDAELDRLHPLKGLRPVASGRVSVSSAWIAAIVCVAVSVLASLSWRPLFGLTLIVYVGIQAAYTLKLKHVPLVDVFVIAIGFVLRAMAGGLAIRVEISPWLLICAFLMALFLALCKRRHERRMIDERQIDVARPSLALSRVRLFDQLITVTAAAVLVAYAVYTQWPDTVHKFGTNRLFLTIPFVAFGLFRYLDLVYRGAECDQPEHILLTDAPLIVDMLLFGACVLWVAVL